ncbi:MAG: amino acid adenylation domain-containing protein, partial [Gemmatimonadota bacterium]
CLERSAEMVVSVLATWKAGGAYVPLDPAYPLERLRFIVEDAGLDAVVTQSDLRSGLPEADGLAVVELDADWAQIGAGPRDETGPGAGPGDVAYVIYTSGSTGVPKGVLVEHRSVCNLIAGLQRTVYEKTAGRGLRVGLNAPLVFDASVQQLAALAMGHALYVIPAGARHDPQEFVKFVRDNRLDAFDCVPSHLRLLLAAGLLEEGVWVPSLVLPGGEAIDPALWNRLSEAPRTAFFNMYGPTECTVDSTTVEVGEAGGTPTIGRPLANVRAYVLDAHLEPVPIGVPGEIYIGGPGVARGYLNRPELDRERFLPDPFDRPNGRMYRTGDRARWLASGHLEYLGRLDDQVKVRGFRVELGEIEAALGAAPGVRAAAVTAHPDSGGDLRLVAYVEFESKSRPGDETVGEAGDLGRTRAIRDALSLRLPEYMIPSLWVELPELPLTSSGKIDRRALPVPRVTREVLEVEYVAPRDSAEAALAEIWSEVLGAEKVGVHDNFFDLGGHSLLATQVVARVRSRHERDLPLRALFESPTVAELARSLRSADAGGFASGVPITPVAREGELPLSFGQERLWFLDQLHPGGIAYNIPAAVRLDGELDQGAIERAMRRVVARHEVLRTRFEVVDGRPRPRIEEEFPFDLDVEDLSALDPEERESRLRHLLEREARTPFDLEQGPLFRFRLLRCAPDSHVAILVMHHIVSDGWSAGILIRELSSFYADCVRGVEPVPDPLPAQYVDYAAWQRGLLRGEELARQLDFWKRKLKGPEDVLALPTDRPRSADRTGRGGQVRFTVDPEVGLSLRGLARDEGASLFMILVAAFQALLSRYTGQDSIRLGTPIANRGREEIEGLIGFFVNTLVLQADLSGRPTFRQLLAQVRETALEAYAHQDLPFERLVEELQPERDLGHAPLFQAMFVMQNAPAVEAEPAGLRISPVELDAGTAMFDLTLSMQEDGDDLSGSLEYDADLFDADSVRRLASHFEILLAEVARAPDRRIGALPLVEEEEASTLRTWSAGPPAELPAHPGIHRLIAELATTLGDAPAVEGLSTGALAAAGSRTRLTYAELEDAADRLAARLRRAGSRRERLVGLCLDRSVEFPATVLAIWKTGAAYVPLDPSYPADRLRFMIEDSDLRLLITRTALRDSIPVPSGVTVLCVDEDRDPGSHEQSVPGSDAAPDDLAYVIYTSGSTGRPKGAQIEHRGIVNTALRLAEWFEIGPGSRVLQFASPSFDASVSEIVMALTAGGCLVEVGEEDLASGSRILEVLARERITAVTLPPSLLAVTDPAGADLPDLRVVASAGETCTWEIARRWVAPHRRFLNGYGPTETSIAATYFEVGEIRSSGSVPIGNPLANVTVHVLDRERELAPIGVPGELYVGGAGVGRGYLGNPELTTERFLADPFGREGARLYRTGDRVRWRKEGHLEFLGRLDDQVKIRGFRVEIGEVEAVLSELEGVRQAAVVAVPGASGSLRLVAYVDSEDRGPGAADRIAAWRSHASTRLPGYMIPSAWVELEALPRTPSGKIDRRALPAPDERGSVKAAYAPPSSPEEEVLASIWSSLLGVGRVGIHDDFFALGGHSLLATQVVSRVRDAFGVEVPLAALFENPTVAGLARQVRLRRLEGRGPEDAPLTPVSREGPLPLSFAQQRLWFLDQMEPGSPAYNLPAAVRLQGPLRADVLVRSLNEIVRRHETLRTTFRALEGRAEQVVEPLRDLEVPIEDLRELPPQQRKAVVQARISEDAAMPFDLTEGSLLRVRLLRLEDERHVAILNMHHIVSDGWSMGIFVRELAVLYDAFLRDEQSPLPDLPIQYADFTVWQRGWLAGPVLEEQVEYWRERLRAAPPLLDLPTDRRRPAVQTFAGSEVGFDFGEELGRDLETLFRSRGVTPFMGLLAAFQVLLHRWSGESDILVGTPIANRNRSEIEGLIGFFVNTLVMRTRLEDDPSFETLLDRVRETALGAYAHQDLPFEMLVDVLQPQRDLSHTPVFQVMFTLQNAPFTAPDLSGLRIEPLDEERGLAKFDLSLSIVDSGRVSGTFEYNTDLFDRPAIEQVARRFETLLHGIVADPVRAVSRLPLLHNDEKTHILEEPGRRARSYAAEPPIPDRVEASARRHAQRPAVTCGEVTLTYAELNARANQLAHRLIREGVGPEALVALYVERSVDMVVAILGILKAGGAYLPLEPAYPADRLRFILEDASPRLVITQTHMVGDLDLGAMRVLLLDAEAERLSAESRTDPVRTLTEDNAAYVIYTSGSTGNPKGVTVTHANVVRLFEATDAWYGFGPTDVWTLFHSCAFDFSVWEIWGALFHGGRIVVVPHILSRSPEAFYELLCREGVTVLNQTPSAFRQLVRAEESLGVDAGLALRWIIFGGEALELETLRPWFDRHGDERPRLVNMYGITETTVHVTYRPIGVADLDAGRGSVIGEPIPDLELYLLDEHMEPVPIGWPGEICVGGPGLARGYLGRKDLTAERFPPHPYSSEAGARLYRSGDLARRLPDGDLEYLRRIDTQVQLRGFRIELGEIEQAILRHPAVRETVVVLDGSREGGRLVAYLVPTEAVPSEGELRDHLRRTLPEYMVPALFVTVEAIPQTPNGKIDRRALPKPPAERREGGELFVPPRTREERILASIWEEFLGLERVGIHDGFFDLGGDSILSIQVIARAAREGIRITPKSFFQDPTIAGLARVGDDSAAPAEQGPVEGEAGLTPIQKWFFEHHPESPNHWNTSMLLALEQPLDPELLRVAVHRILEHHDALRARFPSAAGTRRIVLDGRVEDVPFERIDLAGVPDRRLSRVIEARCGRMQTEFDLERGPLARVAYFDPGEGRMKRLLLLFHHLVMDGVSWRILLEDLSAAYRSLARGEDPALPAKTSSYLSWSSGLESAVATGSLDADLTYWTAHARRDLTDLLPDLGAFENTYGATDHVTLSLSETETRRLLADLPAATGAGVREALLVSLVRALAGSSGRRSLLVELEGHGREDLVESLDLTRTVGWFTSIFPAFLDLEGVEGAEAELVAVRDVLAKIPRAGASFGALRYLHPDPAVRDRLAAVAQPRINFNYLGQFDRFGDGQVLPVRIADEEPGTEQHPGGRRPAELYVVAIVTGGELQVRWLHGRGRRARKRVRALARTFMEELRRVVEETVPGSAGADASEK